MPTYNWECSHCGLRYEAMAKMSDISSCCPRCEEAGYKKFSPNKNISIPARFALSRHWHLPDTPSPDSGTAAGNNYVHRAPKKSFKQAFNENWSKAGGA